jgi:hypothetical protein
MNASRRIPILLAASIALACAGPAAVRAQDAAPGSGETLEARMSSFAAAVLGGNPGLPEYFPASGDWRWVHTTHRAGGTRVTAWRFPAAETQRAIEHPGPLWASFHIQPEGQPIGLFLHQLMTRGSSGDGVRAIRWRRVGGTRFVPAGDPDGSGLFVEWRREGDRWIVAALGDERYDGGPLPRWCC